MTWVPGEVIAHGVSATISKEAEGTALKVFNLEVPLIAAQIEAAGAAAAGHAGLPVPAFLGLDEGPPVSLRMEYVDAPPLIDAVEPEGPAFVGKELARCQSLIRHARVPLGAGVLRVATLFGWQIEHGPLPAPLKRELQIELERLPTGDTLCHLDLSPANILWDGARSIIIDWMTARIGPAAADVARTRIILDALEHAAGEDQNARAVATAIRQAYEKATRADSGLAWEESEAWMRVCKAARLQERVAPAERAALLLEVGAGR